jgi:hypothetical protein
LAPALPLVGRCSGPGGREEARLRHFPREPAHEPAQIAGRPDQIVLQAHLAEPAIAGLAQSVTADQFALRAFDGVAAALFFFKRLGLHFLTAGLQ